MTASIPPCPVCLSRASRRVRSYARGRDKYELVECESCAAQYWEPRTPAGASYYEDEVLSMYQGMHDIAHERTLDQRHDRFFAGEGRIAGKRVLDIGCGNGRLLSRLQQAGNEVWGCDFDSRSVESAKQRGLKNVTCESVESFVERSESEGRTFDLITAFDVIEHLTDPVRVLVSIRRILNARGRLVVTVPNRERMFANTVASDFPPHHFFRFDQKSLSHTLQRAGFDQVKVNQFEYGYAGGLAIEVIRRPLKSVLLKAAQKLRGSAPTRPATSNEHSGAHRTTRTLARHLKQRVPQLANQCSRPIEEALECGFKLYGTAVNHA